MNTDTLKSEAQIKRELTIREPHEWIALINKYRGNLKTRLACLIWWDFYSMKESKDRCDYFDKYIALPHKDHCQDAIKEALIECGYSEDMATQRTKVKSRYENHSCTKG